MRANWIKRAGWTFALGVGLAGVIWFAWPGPIAVDLASVTKGPMEVTVDDEARTRVRHVYTISAPIAGKVLRISQPSGANGTSLHIGDPVAANETVIAVMQPMTPGFIDVRSRQELQAVLGAADAAINLAEAEVRRIEANLDFSRGELRRAEALARTDTIPAKALDKAKLDVATSEAALESARAQLEVRRSERSSIAARLIDPASTSPTTNATCCIQVRAPITGSVLKIIQDSEAVVAAGTPLVEIGDLKDLEVIADLLSTDAVHVKPGSTVRIDGWGGSPVQGRVVRVDPAGFLKLSALGIEEQRVRTTIDFDDPPAMWSSLGHDYRVIVHVTTWKSENVLRIPVGSLFRQGEDWAVFSVAGGRLRMALVKIGNKNNRIAEVLSGLSEGDRVVLHPSDRTREGISVIQREAH